MKKLFNYFAVMAVVGLAGFMTGCGDDSSSNNGAVVLVGFAPATLANHSMTVTENGQSRDLQFAATGGTFTQFESGTTNAVGTGTFDYSKQAANTGQLILTTTAA